MQVSPINNLNFKGHFIKNSTLDSLVQNSSKESIERFNSIVKRASEKNDKQIFTFIKNIETDARNSTKIISYNLIRTSEDNDNPTLRQTVTKYADVAEDTQAEPEENKNILKNFLPTLEVLYPQINKNAFLKK
jgi:hypothetical protein